jgi:hypothetical protein
VDKVARRQYSPCPARLFELLRALRDVAVSKTVSLSINFWRPSSASINELLRVEKEDLFPAQKDLIRFLVALEKRMLLTLK